MKPILPMLLSMVAVLAGCEGSHDLGKKACLPLTLPATLSLQQEAGLYSTPRDKQLILSSHPRDTTNDGFNQFKLVKVLPPGTSIRVDRLGQRWGFDSGLGRIGAFGTSAEGDAFEYGWGVAKQIGRAPWEPASTPPRRDIDCGV